jgi:hypothetical protein
MAKKRAAPIKKKKPAKPAARQAPSSSPPPQPSPASGPAAVVLFTLRDAGASPLRYHSDHPDVERARVIATALANSPDIADAFVIRGAEIYRRS